MNEKENEVVATGGVTISNNPKGNRRHSKKLVNFLKKESTGETGENSENVTQVQKEKKYLKKEEKPEIKDSITIDDVNQYLPKTKLDGNPRIFVKDLSEEEVSKIHEKYTDDFSEKLEIIAYNAKNFDTSTMKDREPLREELYNKEIQKQLDKFGPKKKERKVTFIIGLPGAGKSYVTSPLLKNGSYEIDADNFTNAIPEFIENEDMVKAVHEEASALSKRLFKEKTEEGYNMVIGKVGGSFGSIKKMLDTLQENHYEADVIWMDVPFDVSIKRNIDRYKSGKIKSKQSQRFVPVEVSTDADKGIADTFTQMYNHPIVKTGTIYSNDVPVGVPPKMLHSFKKIK